MSKENGEVRLPKPFEALLQKWPEPERDALFWDDRADKVQERLEGASWEASSHEDLLAPPLPAEPGEGSLEAAPASEPARVSPPPPPESAPPRSLVELARMSLEAEKKTDSNDIAIESLSMSSRARASAPALAASSSQRISATPASSAAPPPEPAVQAAPVTSLPAERAKRSAVGPLAMAAVALMGLAAAAMIVLRAQHKADAPLALGPQAPAPMASAAAPATAETPRADLEIGDLEPKAAAGAPNATPRPGNGAPNGAKDDKLAQKGPAETGKAAAKPTAEEKTGPSPTPAKPEKDDEGAKMKPAATAGDIPDKPSVGAVQAAIGSVLGGARACVAGQDAPSQATVTFSSDGRVQSVAVSGPAAGTPAEACIKAALSKARVQAFARPTYSVGTPVRP